MDLERVLGAIKEIGKKAEKVRGGRDLVVLLAQVTDWLGQVKTEREEALQPLKVEMEAIKAEYEQPLGMLTVLDEEVRGKLVAGAEEVGVAAIEVDGAGRAEFRSKFGMEVVDLAKVPKKYLCVDERAVKADVKKGVSKIAGLKIKPALYVQFTPAKKVEQEENGYHD